MTRIVPPLCFALAVVLCGCTFDRAALYASPDSSPSEAPTSEMRPDAGPDIQPDSGPDIQPDSGPDIQPDSGPDIQPDSGPDIQPDSGPDIQPDSGPDIQPDSGPDIQPDSGLPDIPQVLDCPPPAPGLRDLAFGRPFLQGTEGARQWVHIDLERPHAVSGVGIAQAGNEPKGLRVAYLGASGAELAVLDRSAQPSRQLCGSLSALGVRHVLVSAEGGDLSLSEVEVWGWEATNIALGKKAFQSSIATGGQPERAVDGDTSGDEDNGQSSARTSGEESDPWWRVDFTDPHQIDGVTLWNRAQCCGDQRSDVRVEYLDVAAEVIVSHELGAAAAEALLPAPAAGVYAVRVRLSEDSTLEPRTLALTEVQVWGSPVTNVALGRHASTSSLGFDNAGLRPAEYAVDGLPWVEWSPGSFAQTEAEPQASWTVELDEARRVHGVTLWTPHIDGEPVGSRLPGDSPAFVLSNFRVELLDASRNVVEQWQSPGTVPRRSTIQFDTPDVSAVRIRLNDEPEAEASSRGLTLMEVEVWAWTKSPRSFTAAEVRNPGASLCLDSFGGIGQARMYGCHGQGGNQAWDFDAVTGELRSTGTNFCLAAPSGAATAQIARCDPRADGQRWVLDEVTQELRNLAAGRCLDSFDGQLGFADRPDKSVEYWSWLEAGNAWVSMAECHRRSGFQVWRLR